MKNKEINNIKIEKKSIRRLTLIVWEREREGSVTGGEDGFSGGDGFYSALC